MSWHEARRPSTDIRVLTQYEELRQAARKPDVRRNLSGDSPNYPGTVAPSTSFLILLSRPFCGASVPVVAAAAMHAVAGNCQESETRARQFLEMRFEGR